MDSKPNIQDFQPTIGLIAEALRALPGVKNFAVEADPHAMESGADFEISFQILGQRVLLFVNEKKTAYPRDVRAAAWQLSSIIANRRGSTSAVPMLIAPVIPESSRQILREEKIAYGDSSGSLYLPIPGAFVFVDRPASRGEARKAPNIFKGKTTQILHVLLCNPEHWWHVNELAARADISVAMVHHVIRVLEDNLWMERRGKGPNLVRLLREPGAVLNAWREVHSLKQYEVRSFFGWAQSPNLLRRTVTNALEEIRIPYALTLSSGAELVAPFVTGIEKVSVLVSNNPSLDAMIKNGKLEPTDEGSNVTFFVSKLASPFLERRQLQDAWVASDIQLYLDLWASPARGKEQAEHLRKERLAF